MVTDRVGDMLNRLKNAGAVGHSTARVPYSALNFSILQVLHAHGFVKEVGAHKKGERTVDVGLLYKGGKHRIRGLRRYSKPSRRIYKRVGEIRPVMHGYGMMVVSTPKGLKTDNEARKEKVGGEALFTIW